jgi:hypothetical protein
MKILVHCVTKEMLLTYYSVVWNGKRLPPHAFAMYVDNPASKSAHKRWEGILGIDLQGEHHHIILCKEYLKYLAQKHLGILLFHETMHIRLGHTQSSFITRGRNRRTREDEVNVCCIVKYGYETYFNALYAAHPVYRNIYAEELQKFHGVINPWAAQLRGYQALEAELMPNRLEAINYDSTADLAQIAAKYYPNYFWEEIVYERLIYMDKET